MSVAFVQIGERKIPLTIERSVTGHALGFRALIDSYKGGGYTYAQVWCCHGVDCPATRNGKRNGPCSCGARGLYAELVQAAGEEFEDPEKAPAGYREWAMRLAAERNGV